MNEPGWARTPRKPLLFAISALGSFMTSVSQDLGFTSTPKDSAFHSTASLSLHWGIGIDERRGQREERHLLATIRHHLQHLVFPGGLPCKY